MVGQRSRVAKQAREDVSRHCCSQCPYLTQSKCLIRVSYCIIFKISQTFFICDLYDISFCLHVLKIVIIRRVWKTLSIFFFLFTLMHVSKVRAGTKCFRKYHPTASHPYYPKECQNVLQKTQSTLCISLLTHLPYYFEMTV